MGREEGKQEEIILAFSRKLWVLPNIDVAEAFCRRNQFPFGNAAVILLGWLLCLLFPTWILWIDFIPFLPPDLKEHNNWCFLRGFNIFFFLIIVYFFILTVIWSEPVVQTSKIQIRIDEWTLLMFCDIAVLAVGCLRFPSNGSGVWLLSTSARLELHPAWEWRWEKYLSYTYTIKLGFHGTLGGERYMSGCLGFFFSSNTKHPSILRSLELEITPNEVFFCCIISVLVWLVQKQCSSVTVVEEPCFAMHF